MRCRCGCQDISIETLQSFEEGICFILDKSSPILLAFSIVGMLFFGLCILFENKPDFISKGGFGMAVFLYLFSLAWLFFH